MRFAVLTGFLLAVGAVSAAPAPDPPVPPPRQDAGVPEQFTPILLNVIEQIVKDHVREVSRADLLVAAFAGLYEDARIPFPRKLEREVHAVCRALGAGTSEVDDGVPMEPAIEELKKLIHRVVAEVRAVEKNRPGSRPSSDPFSEAKEKGESQSIPVRQLILAASRGMMQVLDPYSGIIGAEEYHRHMGEDDDSQRIGLELRENLGFGPSIVREVQPGGPAQRAGLRPGDEIRQINGESSNGKTSLEIHAKLNVNGWAPVEKPGEPVQTPQAGLVRPSIVVYRRPGKMADKEVELIAESFHAETVFGVTRQEDNSWSYWLDRRQGLAHVRVGSLGKGTTAELRGVLMRLKDEGLRGLVLDLRWSPGGYLLEATECAGLFLGAATVATVKSRSQPDNVFRSAGGGKFTDFPMVVLVNAESSGGAELIAAALQDHKRALVAGQRTRGKGNIQTSVYLGIQGVGMKLTSGVFLRPSGKGLHRFPDSKPTADWGVRPDAPLAFPVSPDLNRSLGEWWQTQTLRPGWSRERLPLDDPDTDAPRQSALAALRKLLVNR